MIADGTFYNISGIAIALAKNRGVQGYDVNLRDRFLQKLDIIMDETGPGDELAHLLSSLQDHDIRMGIVTFQRLPRLQRRLEIWKLKQYFRSIVTQIIWPSSNHHLFHSSGPSASSELEPANLWSS